MAAIKAETDGKQANENKCVWKTSTTFLLRSASF